MTGFLTHRVTPHAAPLLILAGSAFALAGAQVFERIMGLAACDLCYLQRYPYWVAGALAIAGLIALRRGGPRLVADGLLVLAVGALAVTAGIAGYHTGIEQGWWPGPGSCTGTAGGMPDTLDAFAAEFDSTARITACDQAPWSIAGLSIAALNGLLALGLIGGAIALRVLAGRAMHESGGRSRFEEVRP